MGSLPAPLRSFLHGRGHEHRKRTLVKTVGYRAVMLLITVVVAFYVTSDVGDAVNIGIATNALKTGTYYGYERLWSQVTWGTLSTR